MSHSQIEALKAELDQYRPAWLQSPSALWVHAFCATFLLMWCGLVRPTFTTILVLAGPLVITSLMLRLADDPTLGPVSTVVQWLRVLVIPTAILFTFASAIGSGFFSFWLALPWFLLSARIILLGALRLLSRSALSEVSLGLDIALASLGLSGLAASLHVMGIGGAGSARAAIALMLCGAALPAVISVLAVINSTERLGLATMLLGLATSFMVTLSGATGLFVGSLLLGLIAVPTVRALTGTATDKLPFVLQKLAALPIGLAAIAAIYYTASVRFELDLLLDGWSERIAIGCFAVGAMLALLAANWLSQPFRFDGALPLVNTKFHVGPRSEAQMESLREAASRSEATPIPGLLAGDLRPGFREQSWSLPVADFEHSCEALWSWAGHEHAGIALQPERPKIAVGETVAMAIPLGPLTVSTSVRIVSIIDEPDQYGFTYWTLNHHVFAGQVSFMVQRTPNGAKATISSVSKPSVLASSLLPPVSQALDASIALKCLEGIGEAEAAVIDERMSNLLSDLDKQQYTISREKVMNERATALPVEDEPIEAEPSELDQLFSMPFDGLAYDPSDDEHRFEDAGQDG